MRSADSKKEEVQSRWKVNRCSWWRGKGREGARERLRRVDKWNDLFKGEVGSKKHEISTNRLSVGYRQALEQAKHCGGRGGGGGGGQIDFLFVPPLGGDPIEPSLTKLLICS